MWNFQFFKRIKKSKVTFQQILHLKRCEKIDLPTNTHYWKRRREKKFEKREITLKFIFLLLFVFSFFFSSLSLFLLIDNFLPTTDVDAFQLSFSLTENQNSEGKYWFSTRIKIVNSLFLVFFFSPDWVHVVWPMKIIICDMPLSS